MNPLALSSNETTVDGNLKTTDTSAAASHAIYATSLIPTTGFWYFEAQCIRATTDHGNFGLLAYETRGNHTTNSWSSETYRAYQRSTGNKMTTGAAGTAYGSSYTTSDTVACAVDMNNGAVYFAKNNTWQNSGDPTSGASKTGAAFTDLISSGYNWTPMSESVGGTGGDWVFNFGQRPFTYTPTGFNALCQANLNASGTVIVSGSFTGNASADGPFVWMNGVPDTLTINSNAVTFGTHADKLANGFKLRTSSASYNVAGSNTWTATITSDTKNIFKYNTAEGNP